MLKSHIQLHRLPVALNAERNHVPGVRMRCQQIGELDLAVKAIHIVTILIDFIVPDARHDVPNLESGFHYRRAWLDVANVNTAAFALFTGELTQLRIAQWKEWDSSRRETAMVRALRIL